MGNTPEESRQAVILLLALIAAVVICFVVWRLT